MLSKKVIALCPQPSRTPEDSNRDKLPPHDLDAERCGMADFSNIPLELRERPQWVTWLVEERDGKATKVPYGVGDQRASSTDSATWMTFENATAKSKRIGFVFHADDPYCGIDLDKCRDRSNGLIHNAAREIVVALDSYTEVSPSGTGVHTIVRASVPPGGHRRNGTEIYSDGRYFCMTGDHLEDTPLTIENRQAQLDRLHSELFPPKAPAPSRAAPANPVSLDDVDIIEKARAAKNGPNFDELWRGDTGGYDSHSEADLALCNQLAFWCGCDPVQIDRLFRSSGLYREKWDSKREGSTYGQQTIEKAVSGCRETYSPPVERPSNTPVVKSDTLPAEATSSEKPVKPKLTALFDGLVDLVDDKGRLAFLTIEDGELSVLHKVEIDGEVYIPPSRDVLPRSLVFASSVDVLEEYARLMVTPGAFERRLYDDLVMYFKAASELPSENYYGLLSLWVFHTYLHEQANFSPIICLFGVQERGKSRTGHAMSYAAYRGWHTESLREAYIFRMTKDFGGSIFFDVRDIWNKTLKEGSDDILLLRFQKGATVPRVNNPDRGPFEHTDYYPVFGPTVIGTNVPPHLILDSRSIGIAMPEASREFTQEISGDMAMLLKPNLVAFRAKYMEVGLPDVEKPSRGRLGDIMKPLLQVLRAVAPDEEEQFMDVVRDQEGLRLIERSESLEAEVLRAVINLVDPGNPEWLLVKTVTDHLNEGRTERWALTTGGVGRRLKALGFEKRRVSSGTEVRRDEILIEGLRQKYLGYGYEKPTLPTQGTQGTPAPHEI